MFLCEPTVVSSLTIYQRTPVWVTVKGIGASKHTGNYTDSEKARFAKDPEHHRRYVEDIWDSYETRFNQFLRTSPMQAEVQKIYRDRLDKEVKDPALRKKITPDYGIGCRRITPSDSCGFGRDYGPQQSRS
jgi:cation diffusion facilitator CzcD-associated flavoprotein CzcO